MSNDAILMTFGSAVLKKGHAEDFILEIPNSPFGQFVFKIDDVDTVDLVDESGETFTLEDWAGAREYFAQKYGRSATVQVNELTGYAWHVGYEFGRWQTELRDVGISLLVSRQAVAGAFRWRQNRIR